MTPFQRMFGSGPRGTLTSMATLGGALALDSWLRLPALHGSTVIGWSMLAIGAVMTAVIVAWSLRALPPETRGRTLVTSGPFRFVRHPLYAAFLGPFAFGLALFLDGWVFLAWAALQYPIWHFNVRGEERLMRREFGEDYAEYCRRTGRFLPKPSALWELLRT